MFARFSYAFLMFLSCIFVVAEDNWVERESLHSIDVYLSHNSVGSYWKKQYGAQHVRAWLQVTPRSKLFGQSVWTVDFDSIIDTGLPYLRLNEDLQYSCTLPLTLVRNLSFWFLEGS